MRNIYLINYLKDLSYYKKYFQDIAVVFSGTAFGEIVLVLSTPILAKIYSPEDFGRFGFLVTFSSFLAKFSTLRYENSIIISRDVNESFEVGRLCQYLTFTTNLLFTILTSIIFYTEIISINVHDRFDFIFLIPLLSLSTALFQIQVLRRNREEKFKSSSKIKVKRGLFIVFLSIIFGMIDQINDGLVWAFIISDFLASFLLRIHIDNAPKIEIINVKKIIKRYKNFLYYSFLGDLMNNLTSQYPLMIFPFLFDNAVIGYLTLAYRILGTPVRFIIKSISEVFFQQASKEIREKNDCRTLFLMTSKTLFIVSLIVFIILYVISDYIFEMFFGQEWKITVKYIKLLVPLFIIHSIVSPVSSMIYVAEKQDFHLYWVSGNLLLTTIGTFISYYFFKTIHMVLLFFVITSSLAYFVYFMILLKLTKK